MRLEYNLNRRTQHSYPTQHRNSSSPPNTFLRLSGSQNCSLSLSLYIYIYLSIYLSMSLIDSTVVLGKIQSWALRAGYTPSHGSTQLASSCWFRGFALPLSHEQQTAGWIREQIGATSSMTNRATNQSGHIIRCSNLSPAMKSWEVELKEDRVWCLVCERDKLTHIEMLYRLYVVYIGYACFLCTFALLWQVASPG